MPRPTSFLVAIFLYAPVAVATLYLAAKIVA
jgi:hypothetical protein